MVARRLSHERLGPYRAICADDLAAAMALYEWNAEVGGAWWSVIGHLEVVLRNAMHECLTGRSEETCGDSRWYLTYETLFPQETRRLVTEARRRATAGGRGEAPGKVVAELSLGFWRFLLAARYERSLWVPALRFAFPHLLGRGMRRQAHDAIHGLHGLRNRIAHHEPIHDRPLDELHRTALRVAGWICPVTAEWIASSSRVPGLLRRRPSGFGGGLGSPN